MTEHEYPDMDELEIARKVTQPYFECECGEVFALSEISLKKVGGSRNEPPWYKRVCPECREDEYSVIETIPKREVDAIWSPRDEDGPQATG